MTVQENIEEQAMWGDSEADWGTPEPEAPQESTPWTQATDFQDADVPDWGAEPQAAWNDPAPEPVAQPEWVDEPAPAQYGQAVPRGGFAQPASTHHSAAELINTIPTAPEMKATRGWRRWFGLGPGPAELEERADLSAAQCSFGRPQTVVVLNPKGGSSKTTVSLLLASAFGTARGGSVVAVDNNELRGTMPLRTHSNGSQETIRTLLNNAEQLSSSVSNTAMAMYTRHQGSGLYDALVSASDTRAEVTAAEYETLHGLLQRFYQMIVVDTGNNEGAPNWVAAVRSADALVIPVKRSSASTCVAAAQMLEELEKNPALTHLVRTAVVVFTDGPGPVDKEKFLTFKDYFEQRAGAVVELPTDDHINKEGPIDHAQLGGKTRRATLRLAARVGEVLANQ